MTWYTEAPLARRDLASKVSGLNGVTALWGGTQDGFAAEVEEKGLNPAVTYAINPSLHDLGVAGITQRWVARGVVGGDDARVAPWPSALPDGSPLTKDGRASAPFVAHHDGLRVVRTPGTIDSGYGYPLLTGDDPGAGSFTALVIARQYGGGGNFFAHRGIRLGAASATSAALGVAPNGTGGSATSAPSATATIADLNVFILTSDGEGAVSLKANGSAAVTGTVTPSSATATKLDCIRDYIEVAIWPTVLSEGDRSAVYAAVKAAYPSLP